MTNEKKVFDITQMEKFDVKTKAPSKQGLKIKIKDRSISLPATFAAEMGIDVFISKDGTQIVFMQGKDGFPVNKAGKGGAGRIIYCGTAIAYLKQNGIEIPKEAQIHDGTDGTYYALLKPKMKPEEAPRV